jgi:hypothetical protein
MKNNRHWQQTRAQLQQEWQTNKRLQIIAGAAALLFIIWVHVQLDNWRDARATSAHAAQVRLMDMRQVAGEHFWPERAAEAEAAAQSARQQLWQARSEGEAQALLRDWLEQQARTQGLAITRINVDVETVRTGARYRAVRADIQGTYTPGAWQEFLEVISTHTPRLVVEFEQLNITSARNQRYRLTVAAWFEIGAAAPSEGANP